MLFRSGPISWRDYPAVGIVDMNSNTLNNVVTIQGTSTDNIVLVTSNAGGVQIADTINGTNGTLTIDGGNNLLWNGVILNGGGGGGGSTWSQYPATQSVDLATQNIINCGAVQNHAGSLDLQADGNTVNLIGNGGFTFTDAGTHNGGTFTVDSSNNLYWNGTLIGAGGGDVSQWSKYTAVSTVDLVGFGIINMSGITFANAETITGDNDALTLASPNGAIYLNAPGGVYANGVQIG